MLPVYHDIIGLSKTKMMPGVTPFRVSLGGALAEFAPVAQEGHPVIVPEGVEDGLDAGEGCGLGTLVVQDHQEFVEFIAMAIVPAILIQVTVGAVAFWAYNKTTENQVIEQNRELAHLVAEQLVAYLTRTYQDVGRMMPILDAMAAGSTDFTFLGPSPGKGEPGRDGGTILLDASGAVTFAAQDQQLIGQNWSERKYVEEALLTRQPAFSNLINDGIRGEGRVIMAMPLINQQDELLGVMLEEMHLTRTGWNRFCDEISELLLWTGEARQMYVVDGMKLRPCPWTWPT